MPKKFNELSKDQIIDGLLNAKSLTNDFSDSEIELLSEIVQPEKYDKNSLIVEEDSSSRDIMIINQGQASVEVKLRPDSPERGRIGKIRANSVIGEFSFIDGSRRSADVRAVVDTIVFRIPHEQLNMICGTNNRVGYKVMRNLAVLMSERLRDTNFELREYLYI